MIHTPTRRGLITGLVSLVAAPAIVRAASLMPVKALEPVEFYEMPMLCRLDGTRPSGLLFLGGHEIWALDDGSYRHRKWTAEGPRERQTFNKVSWMEA